MSKYDSYLLFWFGLTRFQKDFFAVSFFLSAEINKTFVFSFDTKLSEVSKSNFYSNHFPRCLNGSNFPVRHNKVDLNFIILPMSFIIYYICKLAKKKPNLKKFTRSGKTTAIRRIAVRETGVSQQYHVPHRGHPLKPPVHHRPLYRIEGFNGTLNSTPIMPRDNHVNVRLTSLVTYQYTIFICMR